MIFNKHSIADRRHDVKAGSNNDGMATTGSTTGSTTMARSLSKVKNVDINAGFAAYDPSARCRRSSGDIKVLAGLIERKGKALLRKLSHHASDGVKSLHTPLTETFRSRAGSFTLPQPYAQHAALRAPKDFERLGLRSEEAAVFQALAKEKGWEIFVRTGTSARTVNVGLAGLRPKPGGMYQKTNKNSVHTGLVVYKAWELEKALSDMAAINHPDSRHAPLSLQVLAEEGIHLREIGAGLFGVRDEAGNFFCGDVDVQRVDSRQPDGHVEKVSADVYVPLFNKRLMATGLHGPQLLESTTVMKEKEYGVLPHSPVQHGAHDDWAERNNADYAGGVNMGPLPGVIQFSPDVARHIETVPEYRDILKGMNRDKEYVGAAWTNGRNRLADAHYRKLPEG